MDTRTHLKSKEEIRSQIRDLIREYYKHDAQHFVPGVTKIGYSGANVDEHEAIAVTDSFLDGFGRWLAEGKAVDDFEKGFAAYIGTKDAVVANSGSSALFLAMRTLMNPSVENHLNIGDEVITAALTFPTSLNSIILNGLVPVLADVEQKTSCIDPASVERMITPKTRALLVLHHLGAVADMDRLMTIAKRHKLFVVEDSCDGHGSLYKGRKTGSIGDMGCFSFYSAHQMTMGEGGAVTTNNPRYAFLLRSLKSSGKACYCAYNEPHPDKGACKARFNFKLGEDYVDHRFVTSSIGLKMKVIDLQAAIGVEQLKKLPEFVRRRNEHYAHVANHLKKYSKYVHVVEPGEGTQPCWFAIPLSVRDDAPFDRRAITSFLESRRVETRPMLGGNMELQPAYGGLVFSKDALHITNHFHRAGFFVGCNPAMTAVMRDFMCKAFDDFFKEAL